MIHRQHRTVFPSMPRKSITGFASAFVLFAAVFLGPLIGAAPTAAALPPNILLIMADDLGFSDLGAYGGEIETPSLDRLAADGLRFTQFYNAAVCTATRAALMTGLYPRQEKDGLLRTNMVTLGEVMRQAGYATALVGKWHLGHEAPLRPTDRGFDEFYGLMDGACNHFNPAWPDPKHYGGKYRAFAHNNTLITEFPDGYYTTDAFSDYTIRMIHSYAESAKPFFINLNYTAPHFPLHARPEDIKRYRGKYSDGYKVLRARRYERLVELGIIDPATTRLSRLDHKTGDFRYDYEVIPWEELDEATRRREEARMEVYAAMVDRMDQGIGRVLAALEETGQVQNTLVIFLSDNGGCASIPLPEQMNQFEADNAGIPIGDGRGYEYVGPGWGWAQNAPFRRHKTWTYEGGICTPMIVRWPGVVTPGTMTSMPGHVVDFMPTFLELTDGRYPEILAGRAILPMEGRSLLPILGRESGGPHPRLLFWELFGNRAVRDGDWKLVWGASAKQWELYNLAADRSETANLAAVHRDRVAAMAAKWAAWAEQVEVPAK